MTSFRDQEGVSALFDPFNGAQNVCQVLYVCMILSTVHKFQSSTRTLQMGGVAWPQVKLQLNPIELSRESLNSSHPTVESQLNPQSPLCISV